MSKSKNATATADPPLATAPVAEFDDDTNDEVEEVVLPSYAENTQKFLTPEEEKEIIRRVQNGDVPAFEDLVNAYKQKAYYVALGFVGNHEDALDLSQDAFVKAFKAIKTFDLNSPLFPWFYKFIKYHCLNYIKKNQRIRNDSIHTEDVDRIGNQKAVARLLVSDQRTIEPATVR